MNGRHPTGAKERARRLRASSTDAEKALWRRLRSRQLAGAKFRRHPIGPYTVDFYCSELMLVLEVDGGQHFSEENAMRDALRTDNLERRGLRVMRFSNLDVLQEMDAVLEAILGVIEGVRGKPST